MKGVSVLILILTVFSNIKAQNKECLKDFDYVVNRIKNDYPGYADKVNPDNIEELRDLESNLKEKIKQQPDSCYQYLKDYAAWFKDYHLGVSYNWNSKKKSKRQGYDKRFEEVNLDSLCLDENTIEGVWVGFRGSFVVKRVGDSFVGVSIDMSGYEKNQILFEAIDEGDGQFELTTFRNYRKLKLTKEKASLHMGNSVLEIHNNTRFVRKTSDPIADMAFLSSYIPQYPNGMNTYPLALPLDDSTFYIRVTSFSSSQGNDLVEKEWDEIVSRPNLIIDIRNNRGGQDYNYSKLAELIYTNSYESKGVEWYSTDGTIEDLENAIKNGNIEEGYEEESKDLLKAMKANVGGFVLHPYYGGDRLIERDTIYSYPRQVGIIINSGNASSAEQFLLISKNSLKVTLFGNENTAGILDYSNVTPKELPSGKYNLWLPATRSRRLPNNPIDNIGIAPDVYIPLEPQEQLFNRLDDWVYYVKNYFHYKDKN